MDIYTTIGVRQSTRNLLSILKEEHKVKSYDLLINELVKKDKTLNGLLGLAPKVPGFVRDEKEYERKI